jgi:rusticyanin
MTRKRISVLAGAAVIAAAGIGTGAAIAASSSPGQPAAASSAAPASSSVPAASASPGYSWYRSLMSGYYGGMMMGGGSAGGWMSEAGYQWMTGGTSAPGWMRGGTLPGPMMGTSAGTGPGTIMGRLWADAPGPRVSAAQAATLGGQVPAGARIDRAADTITFTATTVRLTVLARPSGGPDETFRIAGLTNPAIVVPAGSQVSIEVINADPDTAHGLEIAASQDTTWMPMMTARPAFTGSALWFLGNPTSAGMHAGTLTFTAATPGTYQYLCPVPGHARDGMAGPFTVR